MLKFAIVGTGIIANRHIEAINSLDEVELVAVCDINEEKAKQYSEDLNVPYSLNYKELPERFDFDAVILNLPHGLHCEATEFFLDCGKHVLVEKPMANTPEECKRMIEASKRNGKKLGIAHIQRHFDAITEAKRIYGSGELGKLCMYTENRSTNYFYDGRPKWFLSKKSAGGGIVMNFAAHAFDKLLSVMEGAKIISIDAQCGNYLNDYDIDGHAQIFAKFDNGVSSSITLFGYLASGYEAYYYFTKGAVRIVGDNLEINRGDGQGFVEQKLSRDKLPFVRQLDEFCKLIKNEKTDTPDGEYGAYIIDAIKTVYEKSDNI
ncbi:MAG: Gfo/Idh/MocA family oxidoreductase [Ruminococcaceae bacterium]|nr:Gfo/Idh/MocA family oxidoreductase [Oscillospiraceae bacterium]